MQNPAPIAFVAEDGDVRVNFGIFAGRDATQAELDELAQTLLESAKSVTLVAENRVVADREMEAVRAPDPDRARQRGSRGDPARRGAVGRGLHR